jgi:hypothetical protein
LKVARVHPCRPCKHSAYAAATIGSADVINDSLLSEDIKNETITSGDIRPSTIASGRIADGSVTGSDIKQNTIGSLRIADNSLGSTDIKNGSLNDEDIGASTFVGFEATIGTIAGHTCIQLPVTGVGGRGDHLLLTPDIEDGHGAIIYAARYNNYPSGDQMDIQACNPTANQVNDGTTHFNLLVIDAQ